MCYIDWSHIENMKDVDELLTLQQQQEQGEGHRCNEMIPEEHQQQIEAFK